MEKMPRILIAGAGGFVGSRALIRYPQATVLDRTLLHNPGEALEAAVREYGPDIVLNAAAISDIGACERDPEGSWRANVLLPVALARGAEAAGAKLISFSSDQVYTGCTHPGPYREAEELPEPKNLYARHKLEAEQRVLALHPGAVLLRATWMYDMPLYGHANRGNFLVNTLGTALAGGEVTASSREYRGITYVRQVVELLDAVFTLPGGVYNYGSENPLNMVQTARALLRTLGTADRVRDTEEARRNLWMDCGKLKAHGIFFDTTAEGFARCAGDYGLGNGETAAASL